MAPDDDDGRVVVDADRASDCGDGHVASQEAGEHGVGRQVSAAGGPRLHPATSEPPGAATAEREIGCVAGTLGSICHNIHYRLDGLTGGARDDPALQVAPECGSAARSDSQSRVRGMPLRYTSSP